MDKVLVFELIGSLNDGGAETLVTNYAKLINRNIFDVRIITLYNVKKSANVLRVKKHNLNYASLYKNDSKFTKILHHCFGKVILKKKFIDLFSNQMPKCIHLHVGVLKYLPRIPELYNNIKVLFTCHNEPTKAFDEEDKMIIKWFINNTNFKLVALHNTMKNELEQMFNVSSIIVLNNGIDFSEFKNNDFSISSKKEALGISSDSFVVGHIGRFNEQKNHEFLIDIFCEILKINNNAFLLLIGEGQLKSKIVKKIKRKNIQNKVLILSKRVDVNELLGIMDVFVFPSLFEGLSLTLIEAQVSSLYCFISDTIKKENVLSKKTIQISLSVSPDEWAQRICSLNEINNEYNDIDCFDMNNEISKIENVYLN